MNANNSKISLFAKSRHSHGVKKFWVLMFLCAQYNLSAKLFRHCANFNHFYSSSPFLSGSIFVSAIKEGVFLGALQIPSQSSRQILSSDFESTLISFMQRAIWLIEVHVTLSPVGTGRKIQKILNLSLCHVRRRRTLYFLKNNRIDQSCDFSTSLTPPISFSPPGTLFGFFPSKITNRTLLTLNTPYSRNLDL